MQEVKKISKEEMIERLMFSKEDILFGKIDFRWIHSREFKYNGDMYDIVKKEETEKELIVFCINDTKEKKLEEEFENRIHKNSTEDKTHHIVKNLIFNFISEPAQTEEFDLSLAYKHNYYSQDAAHYKSFLPDIPSPPPRLA